MSQLPDITSKRLSNKTSTLKWVGMENIALPVTMIRSENETLLAINSSVNLYVSLDDAATKGIHMSRLHILLNRLANKDVNKQSLTSLLQQMIDSQQGISKNAKVQLSFELLLQKPSLLSNHSGFQSYPITVTAELIGSEFDCQLSISIPYSSTCPCSDALANEVFKDEVNRLNRLHGDNNDAFHSSLLSLTRSIAVAHSQRSYAHLALHTGNNEWPDIETLIFQLEAELGTPLQTIVKRQDEQEFAKLCAENLMFCEDAARKLKECINSMKFVNHFSLKVEHHESLHAHNVVVIDD